ncbi:MAG: 3-keto-disaccharide hydrolase [Planctomycetota bacterium]
MSASSRLRLWGVCAFAVWMTAAFEIAPAHGAKPNTLTPEELAEGWILLFDGETLFGWKAASDANWEVSDGAISVSEGEPGLLCTTSQFGDYVLKVDFRSAPGTNSGVFLRTSPKPSDVTSKCYELNIADVADNPFPTGSFVQRQRCEGDHDSADWQTFEVTADGARFLVTLDGQLVLDYTDPKPPGRGFIGLQLNSGKVEFRNVKLKPLGMKSLFNGKDLTGWKTYPEMPSKFTVTPEGWLNVKDGRGQLETVGRYADFTMQLEAFVNGEGLNSGIFFRSIPGDMTNGYESQIHNGCIDGDRTKPKDCGTGGIFRRQNARKVVADDFTWFYKTIHVDDKHMAAWVNGYQVSDWTDTRPPDENPRRGLRLEAGTIIIQGHDPTTDLSFRNLRIAEIPER